MVDQGQHDRRQPHDQRRGGRLARRAVQPIGGNATLTNITALDPGDPGRTVAVVENTVGNNLNCTGLAPGVSPGFIPGEVNHVGHKATGQCAAISEPL